MYFILQKLNFLHSLIIDKIVSPQLQDKIL